MRTGASRPPRFPEPAATRGATSCHGRFSSYRPLHGVQGLSSIPVTLDDMRRMAATHTLFTPTTLPRALNALGFVQADPIRAPARAQDLTLRHRVRGYRAGDLERRYPRLPVEEDYFVNYGFLPRANHQLMHPRTARTVW